MRVEMADDKGKGRAAQIDENLKRVYEEFANQELPQKFKDLIEQLRSKGTPQ